MKYLISIAVFIVLFSCSVTPTFDKKADICILCYDSVTLEKLSYTAQLCFTDKQFDSIDGKVIFKDLEKYREYDIEITNINALQYSNANIQIILVDDKTQYFYFYFDKL